MLCIWERERERERNNVKQEVAKKEREHEWENVVDIDVYDRKGDSVE